MLHNKFLKSSCRFQRKSFLKAFAIYGRSGHLGHVTSIMSSDFHFLVPESFHTKFELARHSSF